MAITKGKKEEVVAKIADALSDAASVVFVHFKGLTVADTSAMRRTLRDQGVGGGRGPQHPPPPRAPAQ